MGDERRQGTFRAEDRVSQGVRSTFLVLLVLICSHGTGWGGVSALGLALFIFVLKWEAEKGNRG